MATHVPEIKNYSDQELIEPHIALSINALKDCSNSDSQVYQTVHHNIESNAIQLLDDTELRSNIKDQLNTELHIYQTLDQNNKKQAQESINITSGITYQDSSADQQSNSYSDTETQTLDPNTQLNIELSSSTRVNNEQDINIASETECLNPGSNVSDEHQLNSDSDTESQDTTISNPEHQIDQYIPRNMTSDIINDDNNKTLNDIINSGQDSNYGINFERSSDPMLALDPCINNMYGEEDSFGCDNQHSKWILQTKYEMGTFITQLFGWNLVYGYETSNDMRYETQFMYFDMHIHCIINFQDTYPQTNITIYDNDICIRGFNDQCDVYIDITKYDNLAYIKHINVKMDHNTDLELVFKNFEGQFKHIENKIICIFHYLYWKST